jgi:hypothetical protein
MDHPVDIQSCAPLTQTGEKRFSSFGLSRGYVQYKPAASLLSQEEQQGSAQTSDYFLVFKNAQAKPIRLYRQQMLQLAQQLPEAFSAVNKGDCTYCEAIATHKTHRITLEVNHYNDQHYLFLKKSFKPADKADDPQQDWIYTKSNVQLDPLKDNPFALEDFVLSCC